MKFNLHSCGCKSLPDFLELCIDLSLFSWLWLCRFHLLFRLLLLCVALSTLTTCIMRDLRSTWLVVLVAWPDMCSRPDMCSIVLR